MKYIDKSIIKEKLFELRLTNTLEHRMFVQFMLETNSWDWFFAKYQLVPIHPPKDYIWGCVEIGESRDDRYSEDLPYSVDKNVSELDKDWMEYYSKYCSNLKIVMDINENTR